MTTFEAGEYTLRKVRDHVWELPKEGDMRVPARVFASERLLEEIVEDKTLEQLRNATHLPGIKKYAICMPDGHQGYGFPVGGVAGIDAENGCISPGAIGYDVNCGVRMLKTNLEYDDVRGREEDLVDALFEASPLGARRRRDHRGRPRDTRVGARTRRRLVSRSRIRRRIRSRTLRG